MEQIQQDNNKLGIFEQYKLLFDGKQEDLTKIKSSSLHILIQWLSFGKTNLNICQKLNKYYMFVNSDVLKWILYYKLDVDNKYIKYLKSIKDDKLVFLKDYLKKYFKWSEREYSKSLILIDKLLETEEFKNTVSYVFGFSEKECKKLNISYKKEIKKRKDTGSQSLFSFIKK